MAQDALHLKPHFSATCCCCWCWCEEHSYSGLGLLKITRNKHPTRKSIPSLSRKYTNISTLLHQFHNILNLNNPCKITWCSHVWSEGSISLSTTAEDHKTPKKGISCFAQVLSCSYVQIQFFLSIVLHLYLFLFYFIYLNFFIVSKSKHIRQSI